MINSFSNIQYVFFLRGNIYLYLILRNSNFTATSYVIDLNGEIFFIHDKKIFDLKDFFGIFDKTYLISKLESKNFISNESLIREKNSFFEILSVKSNLIDLYSGNIDVFFKSDKTVLRKGESFELNWTVDNAHEVSINNDVGIVSNKGSTKN